MTPGASEATEMAKHALDLGTVLDSVPCLLLSYRNFITLPLQAPFFDFIHSYFCSFDTHLSTVPGIMLGTGNMMVN